MPLDLQVAAFLEKLARHKSHPIEMLPIEVTRRASSLIGPPGRDLPLLGGVRNQKITRFDGTEIPIRIYFPRDLEPVGLCLYFHGGGWVLNSIDTHDELVRRLTADSGCVFVNVDYRLAPEHKFPAALEDAYTALNWVESHAAELSPAARQIAVAGDSAGGNLAAAVCLMSRDRGGPKIVFQALIYPITDCDFERPSYQENREGYFLTRSEMIWFWNHYVSSPAQMRDPYASPLLASSLCNLPPASILTAEFDPLRDEGEAYAAALRLAGVDVKLRRYDGMIHAFVRRFQQFDAAYEATREVANDLRSAFLARST